MYVFEGEEKKCEKTRNVFFFMEQNNVTRKEEKEENGEGRTVM
jgi:hypothetical protein